MGHGIGICQHGTGDAEDVAGDDVDEGERQHGGKGTARTLLCPAAADGNGEQDVQVIDDRPADVLHRGADGHNRRNVAAAHLHQLAQTDLRPAAGMTAMTVISTLPSFCKKSKLMSPFLPGAAFVVAMMFLLIPFASFCAIVALRLHYFTQQE